MLLDGGIPVRNFDNVVRVKTLIPPLSKIMERGE